MTNCVLIVIVISRLLKRYLKSKRTSLITSVATNQRFFSQRGGQKKLRSDFKDQRYTYNDNSTAGILVSWTTEYSQISKPNKEGQKRQTGCNSCLAPLQASADV